MKHVIKIGSDAATQSKLIDLVISNLYNNPLKSCFVETISNAYDASKETGKFPIIIQIPTENDPTYSVQDFGPGMSPKLIAEVYTQLGVSTKQNKQDAIGSYGIGAMTIQNISDNSIIETIFEGVKYVYQYSKTNIDGVTESAAHLISETPTLEPSGTKITCPIRNDVKLDKVFKYIQDRVMFLDPSEYELKTSGSANISNLEKIKTCLQSLWDSKLEITENTEIRNLNIYYNKSFRSLTPFDMPVDIFINCGGVPYFLEDDLFSAVSAKFKQKLTDLVGSENLYSSAFQLYTISYWIGDEVFRNCVLTSNNCVLGQENHGNKGVAPYVNPIVVLNADMSGILLDTSRESMRLDSITVETISDLLVEMVVEMARIWQNKLNSDKVGFNEKLKLLGSLNEHDKKIYCEKTPALIYFDHDGQRFIPLSSALKNQTPKDANNSSEKITTYGLNAAISEVFFTGNSSISYGGLLMERFRSDAFYELKIQTLKDFLSFFYEESIDVIFSAFKPTRVSFVQKLEKKYSREFYLHKIASIRSITNDPSVMIDLALHSLPFLKPERFLTIDKRYLKPKPKDKVKKAKKVSNSLKVFKSAIDNNKGVEIRYYSNAENSNRFPLLACTNNNMVHKGPILLLGEKNKNHIGSGLWKSLQQFFSLLDEFKIENRPEFIVKATPFVLENAMVVMKEINAIHIDELTTVVAAKLDEEFESLGGSWLDCHLALGIDNVLIGRPDDKDRLVFSAIGSQTGGIYENSEKFMESVSDFIGFPNAVFGSLLAIHPLTKDFINKNNRLFNFVERVEEIRKFVYRWRAFNSFASYARNSYFGIKTQDPFLKIKNKNEIKTLDDWLNETAYSYILQNYLWDTLLKNYERTYGGNGLFKFIKTPLPNGLPEFAYLLDVLWQTNQK